MIVIQRIVTRWTKATRGAGERERRARLPEALALPDDVLVARAACVRHIVLRSADSDYRAVERVEEDDVLRAAPGVAPTSLTLTERAGILDVSFVADGDAGTPRRSATAMRIAPGSFGRARYHGRFQAFDEPWYESKTVNIAYGVTPTRTLFTSDAPKVLLEAEVDLW